MCICVKGKRIIKVFEGLPWGCGYKIGSSILRLHSAAAILKSTIILSMSKKFIWFYIAFFEEQQNDYSLIKQAVSS